MANPARITDFSTTAANNVPSGGETIGTNADDLLRAIQATIRLDLSSKGADIASATTTDLGAVGGFFHDITGRLRPKSQMARQEAPPPRKLQHPVSKPNRRKHLCERRD